MDGRFRPAWTFRLWGSEKRSARASQDLTSIPSQAAKPATLLVRAAPLPGYRQCSLSP
ncbi:hypothetical protein OF83DRAFT_1110106 [Amylostereum chailletii]|nr:hypothetical protein OF83DRAFT_1110106 [Amylostereum chailletii]